MGRKANSKRLLVTGMRRRGETDYEFRIFGQVATHFPPLRVRMSLPELQRWLHEMQTAADGAAQAQPAALKVVG